MVLAAVVAAAALAPCDPSGPCNPCGPKASDVEVGTSDCHAWAVALAGTSGRPGSSGLPGSTSAAHTEAAGWEAALLVAWPFALARAVEAAVVVMVHPSAAHPPHLAHPTHRHHARAASLPSQQARR